MSRPFSAASGVLRETVAADGLPAD